MEIVLPPSVRGTGDLQEHGRFPRTYPWWPPCLKAAARSNELSLIRQNSPPQTLGSPYSRSQALKLHNLTMIYKEIHLCAIVLDVPGKDLGISSLKHYFLQPQRVDNLSYRIRAPGFHVLGNPLGLNHNHVGASLQEPLCLADSPSHVTRPLSLEFLGSCGSSCTELDTHLRLRFETCQLHLLNQAEPVINRDREKPTPDLENVKPHLMTLRNVAIPSFCPFPESMLDESSCRNQHVVTMDKVNDFLESLLGHQRERASRKL